MRTALRPSPFWRDVHLRHRRRRHGSLHSMELMASVDCVKNILRHTIGHASSTHLTTFIQQSHFYDSFFWSRRMICDICGISRTRTLIENHLRLLLRLVAIYGGFRCRRRGPRHRRRRRVLVDSVTWPPSTLVPYFFHVRAEFTWQWLWNASPCLAMPCMQLLLPPLIISFDFLS